MNAFPLGACANAKIDLLTWNERRVEPSLLGFVLCTRNDGKRLLFSLIYNRLHLTQGFWPSGLEKDNKCLSFMRLHIRSLRRSNIIDLGVIGGFVRSLPLESWN